VPLEYHSDRRKEYVRTLDQYIKVTTTLQRDIETYAQETRATLKTLNKLKAPPPCDGNLAKLFQPNA
jgi:hypothetical protein